MLRNGAIGRQYSDINVLILWGAVIERSFPGEGRCRSARHHRGEIFKHAT